MSDAPDTSPGSGPGVSEDDEASLGRMIALTDGVVAIALTLLILEIAVPGLAALKGRSHKNSVSALAGALGAEGDSWIAYGISFYVIAQFWMLHRHVFGGIQRHRDTLAVLNFVFLFSISLMPFTSDLIGTYSENPLSVVIFAGNLILANSATWALLWFSHRNGLLSPRGERVYFGRAQSRGLANLFFYVVSIPVAFWSPDAAKYCWLGLIVAPRIGTVLHQRRAARAAGPPSPPPAESAEPND